MHLEAADAAVGEILLVKFTDSFCYELVGEVVEVYRLMAVNKMGKEITSIWTPANIITCVRIVFIPVFMILSELTWSSLASSNTENAGMFAMAAFVMYALLSLTDKVDGDRARKRGEVTEFGKFLDPIADKLLVFSALLMLLEHQFVNVWFVFIILFR